MQCNALRPAVSSENPAFTAACQVVKGIKTVVHHLLYFRFAQYKRTPCSGSQIQEFFTSKLFQCY